MHPLLHLIATQPRLLADHADAYADLAGAELEQACAGWKRQALLSAGALLGLLVAALLAGVALMLWAITAPAAIHAPWVLWLTPALPAIVGLACVFFLLGEPAPGSGAFQALRRQMRDDWRMLRDVGASA